MCGINGYNNYQEGDRTTAQKMADYFTGRGFDGNQTYSDDCIVLNHSLLATRAQVKRSLQPRFERDSPWVVAFVGQIYGTDSYDALSTQCSVDIDELYKAVNKHGWGFIDCIQGVFSIVVYNKKTLEVRLYRDHSGQRGLYYYHRNGRFIFSSELKPILIHEDTDQSVDYDAVEIASGLGYLPGNKTWFGYIKKLRPGEMIKYNLGTNALSNHPLPRQRPHYKDVDGCLEKVVKLHHLGTGSKLLNLSGGLDSSLLLYLFSKLSLPVESFSTQFDIQVDTETYNQDAYLAARLARHFGKKHTNIIISQKNYLDAFVRSYELVEEPNYNLSIPIHYITAQYQKINTGARVVFSGDGGDELFGGYPHYYANMVDSKEVGGLLQKIFGRFLDTKSTATGIDPWDPTYFYGYYKHFDSTYLANHTKSDIISNYLKTEFQSHADECPSSVLQCMQSDRLNWLAGETFIRTEKINFAHSLETRSPLSYQPLRNYLDTRLTNSDYTNGTLNKVFLRDYLMKKIPEYITLREKKTGWRAPIEPWYGKDLKGLYLDIVSTAKASGSGFINWELLTNKIETTDSWPGREAHFNVTIALLSTYFDLSL